MYLKNEIRATILFGIQIQFLYFEILYIKHEFKKNQRKGCNEHIQHLINI